MRKSFKHIYFLDTPTNPHAYTLTHPPPTNPPHPHPPANLPTHPHTHVRVTFCRYFNFFFPRFHATFGCTTGAGQQDASSTAPCSLPHALPFLPPPASCRSPFGWLALPLPLAPDAHRWAAASAKGMGWDAGVSVRERYALVSGEAPGEGVGRPFRSGLCVRCGVLCL